MVNTLRISKSNEESIGKKFQKEMENFNKNVHLIVNMEELVAKENKDQPSEL